MPRRSDYEPLHDSDEHNSEYAQRPLKESLQRLRSRKASYYDVKWAMPDVKDKVEREDKVKAPTIPIQFVKVLNPIKFRGLNPEAGVDYTVASEPELITVEEDGKTIQYFPAVSMHPETGKPQSFRVVVMDELPKSDITLLESGVLSSDMNDYEFKGRNSGGGNFIGEYGGQYRFRYILAKDLVGNKPNPDLVRGKIILFKQDAHAKTDKDGNPKRDDDGNIIGLRINNDKNIVEYAAGTMKNFYGGDSAATTFLASKPTNNAVAMPDRTGHDTYVASIFKGDEYQQAQDLFRDIIRLHGKTPKPTDKRKRFVGSFNRSWFRFGLLDPETGKCRFQNYETCAAVALLMGDFDIHAGNLMVLAPRDADGNFLRDETGELLKDEDGTIGILVGIDHAGAMRNLTDEVNMDKFRFFMGKLRGSNSSNFAMQPTNHHREIPRSMRVSEKYAAVLERIGKTDINLAYAKIDKIMDRISARLGVKPIMEFGRRMDADIKGELRKLKNSKNELIYPDDKEYNNIKAGKYTVGNSPANEDIIKRQVVDIIRKFWKAKTLARQKSLQQLAVDMKVSLCIKKENGKFVLDKNSAFSLEKILLEHPEYITNNKYHFRGEGQKGFSAFMTSPFHKSILLDLAQQGSKNAALETLRKSLGEGAINQANSNYSITFYRSENERKATPPVPAGVYNIVVSGPVFQNSIYYNKHKNSTPTLSTKNIDARKGLKPGEYSLNFVASDTPGIKGMYIEQFNEKMEYTISAHRLPAELNNRYIFSAVFIKHCNKDLLSADPGIERTLRRLSARVTLTDNDELDLSKLNDEEVNYLKDLLTCDKGLDGDAAKNAFFNDIADEMRDAYKHATTQIIVLDNDEEVVIPSQAYLDFAEKQCESMMLRNGPATVIDILPDARLNGPEHKYNVKNPLLAQAYMLVCAKRGWSFNNETNVPTFSMEALTTGGQLLRDYDKAHQLPPSISVK
jgi:hypothetical protein